MSPGFKQQVQLQLQLCLHSYQRIRYISLYTIVSNAKTSYNHVKLQFGVRPSNYTLSVLVKLADRGRKVDKAFAICEELTTKYNFRLNVHVYANLVQACIRQRDVPRAIEVLERMLSEKVRPDVRTYSLLLRACIESREPQHAAGILRAACGLS